MTGDERKILFETHTGVRGITVHCQDCQRRIENVEQTVYGNGNSGLKERMTQLRTTVRLVWGLVIAMSMVIVDRVWECFGDW